MILKRFYEEGLAHASYLIGCSDTGEALVIDPNRLFDQYQAAAESEGLRITHVTETHIHADFVSGSRELALRSGALLALSAHGGEEWSYRFAADSAAKLLHHGDRFRVGQIEFETIHTPGHTPEHLSFLVTDTKSATVPMGLFTGDFVFVGDVGRPDLLERSASVVGSMEPAARDLYQSLQRFKRLPDHLQIWPAHGAGSPCGKSLGGVPQSTIGYEKVANWAFNVEHEDEFIRSALSGQPDPPPYFARMKQLNRDGPPLLGERKPLEWAAPDDLPRILQASELVIDSRPADEFAAGYVPGTINVQAIRTFITWAGWLSPYDRPFNVIVSGDSARAFVGRCLSLIGLESNVRYLPAEAVRRWKESGRPLQTIPRLSSHEAAQTLNSSSRHFLLDVRQAGEWRSSRIAHSVNIPLGHLEPQIDEIPRGEPIMIVCRVGNRSVTAASILRLRGFESVSDVRGGMAAWKEAGLPVEVTKDPAT